MRDEPDRIDASQLDRFLAGESTPDEHARTAQWIAADPERGRLVAELRGASEKRADPTADTAAAWARLSTWLGINDEVGARRELRAPGRFAALRQSRSATLRAAAAVLLLIGGGTVWREWPSPNASDVGPGLAVERATGIGERASVRLADGSRVTLAPSSRLRVRSGYGRGAREVDLEGEALFAVAHDEARPFRVFTGTTTVEDLGTEFVVRAPRGEAGVRVVVASGIVALKTSANPKGMVLGAGDLGEVGAGGRIAARRGVDVSRYLAWFAGQLAFDDAPVDEVLTELERWYRVDLSVRDPSLAARRLSASYSVDQPVEEVLASLSLAMNARFERHGATLQLVPLP